MNYTDIAKEQLVMPKSSFEQFEKAVANIGPDFIQGNKIMELIDEGKIEIKHFHKLLTTIFHQVYVAGSSTLALAGVMTDHRYPFIREYLLHHAEEEQDHWKWIIQNLRDTGYAGPDPRTVFPEYPTQAYLAFSVNFATRHPIESLAIAFVLESISSQLAVNYGVKAATQLQLSKEQMSFFILHGELDEGHEADLLAVLKEAPLTPEQWAIAEYAAKATLHFYKAMYNHAADC